MDKVTLVDERGEERRKCKAYQHSVRKFRAGVSADVTIVLLLSSKTL